MRKVGDPVEVDLTAEEEALAPEQLNDLAWARVASDEDQRIWGEEPRALALASLAWKKLEARQRDAADRGLRAETCKTLAWAWFANGCDAQALGTMNEASLRSLGLPGFGAVYDEQQMLYESISAAEDDDRVVAALTRALGRARCCQDRALVSLRGRVGAVPAHDAEPPPASNPLDDVDWFEIDRRFARHGLVLPTEAQWEYGCRAGSAALTAPSPAVHIVHMKRANLVLPEQLLEEVVRLSGEKTYSAAVTVAMQEFVRRAKARQILRLRGTGVWEGDLAVMREDKQAPRTSRKAR